MPDGYKISKIYVGTNQVRPPYPVESIVYKMNADGSWNLYIPVSWYSTAWNQNVAYSWKVSVDWDAETTYSWTWYRGGYIAISWYAAWTNHTIMIKPTTEDYWWARAYAWYRVTAQTFVTEIVYDWSYMWFAVSATDTGNYFRWGEYYWCSALIEATEEYLPDTVTTIWERFRQAQYSDCTSLLRAAEEKMSSSATTIWIYFRVGQYSTCSSLIYAPKEKLTSGITTIGAYFRQAQYSSCTSLTYAPEEDLPDTVTSMSTYFRQNQYNYCSALTEVRWWKDLSVWANYYRDNQFGNSTSNKTVKVLSNVWYASYSSSTLPNNRVTTVYVPSAYLSNFTWSSAAPRYYITDSKFVWY